MKDRFNTPFDAGALEKEARLQAFKDCSDETTRKHGLHHAILNESGEVQLVSLFEWAFWFEKNRGQRVIQQDYTQDGNYKVSTVFTGLDMGWNPKRPLYFETMVFGPEEETDWFDGSKRMMRPSLWIDRCSTLAQALAMHKAGQAWLDDYLQTHATRSQCGEEAEDPGDPR